MAKSVFLIHDILDKPFARQLAIDFSLAGATVWLDEAEIGEIHGSMVSKIQENALRDVYLTVILSPNLVKSDWLQHEIETLLNREGAEFAIKVLTLLYKDCVIPDYLADKLREDVRNPENYTSMLPRIIDSLELCSDGKGADLPATLAGKWQGSWRWCGRHRDADLFLSASPTIPSRMIIRYMKSGILTIVQQELDVRISGNEVKLIGTTYRLLERGISLGWNLDTFNLYMGPSGMTLEGINTDKKGSKSPVLFKR
jgi:hypothetical protein